MVKNVQFLGSFWTTNSASWRIYRLLNKIKISSISYALIIRLLAKHSHKAYLVRLRNDENAENKLGKRITID